MAGDEGWCRITVLDAAGSELAGWALDGHGPLDVSVVDALARLRLAAARLGCRLVLREVGPELGELLDLTGLRREMEGQSEAGEEALGVQEGQEEAEGGHPLP
jgi:hypothetical protein